jgi:hypothetical protein
MTERTPLLSAAAAIVWFTTGCTSVVCPAGTNDACQAGACSAAWAEGFPTGKRSLGFHIAVDGEGDIVVDGTFQGTLDLGAGPLTSSSGIGELFVAKLDCTGHAIWSKSYPHAQEPSTFEGDTQPLSLAVGADGTIVVTGSYAGPLDLGNGPFEGLGGFVLALDASGGTRWARHFEGKQGPTEAHGAALDATGNVYVTGVAEGHADLGEGPLGDAASFHGFLAKLDATGATQWLEVLDEGMHAWHHVRFAAPDALVVCGVADATDDFGDGPLPAGQTLSCAKLAAAGGAPQWTRGFVATGAAFEGMALTADGGVALVGAAASADLGEVHVAGSADDPLGIVILATYASAPA